MATTTAFAAEVTFTLNTRAWGAWGDPSYGVKKEDNNNGWFKKLSQSASFVNYADAYYANERVSNSYYNLSNTGMDGSVWFSYIDGKNSIFNGLKISARVCSSDYDPNSGTVKLTFAP